jgi:hypothetical protein
LRLRRALLAFTSPTMTSTFLLHGFELLLLLVVQEGFDLALGVLTDRLHLRATVLIRQGLILEEGLHSLLAVDEQRLDLALLIRRETEGPGQVLKLAIRAHALGTAAGAILRLRLGLGCVVLSESGA